MFLHVLSAHAPKGKRMEIPFDMYCEIGTHVDHATYFNMCMANRRYHHFESDRLTAIELHHFVDKMKMMLDECTNVCDTKTKKIKCVHRLCRLCVKHRIILNSPHCKFLKNILYTKLEQLAENGLSKRKVKNYKNIIDN